MKIITLSLFIVFYAFAINAQNLQSPACIQDKMKILSEDDKVKGVSISEYIYQSDTVYFISSYCCDIMSELYSINCELICHPDGGITGKGDGKCNDFFDKGIVVRNVWIKEDNEDEEE